MRSYERSISVQWGTHGGCSVNIQSSSLCSSCLQYFVLRTLALVSPDSHVYLLTSRILLASDWFFLPAQLSVNSLKEVGLDNFNVHLIFFPFLRDYGPSVPGVQCFAISCLIYIVFLKNCFKQEGKSGPC